MTEITVTFADEITVKLTDLAQRLHITPEELIRVSVEDMLISPDEETFDSVADYVLDKNKELYQRLAV